MRIRVRSQGANCVKRQLLAVPSKGVAVASADRSRQFLVQLIKPSHYDDDGYVIQWWKAWIPSNSLSSVYALTQDLAQRQVLGADLDLKVDAIDETNTVIPIEQIANRINADDGLGLVCLVHSV
jgi:hypothetical protein